MPVISLPVQAMGPFGMPMLPGNGSSGGGGTTFGGKTISQIGTPWVYDGPDANSAVDVFTGLRWVDSGNKLVAAIQTAGSNNSYGIYEFSTTTAYSTQTADISFSSNFLTYNEIADADFSPLSIEFNNDGSVGYFGEDNEIFGFSMSTNYDISTATGTGHTKTSISSPIAPYGYGGMQDIKFNSDGTKMFISEVGGNDCGILEFSLSSAYNVTTRSTNPTATFDPTTASNSSAVLPAIHFNSDGTKMWAIGAEVGGAGVRWLYEYDLSTGFDVSTMSYNNERIDLETLYGIDLAQALTFNDDFSKIYIACGNDGVFEFQWGTGSGGGGGDPSDINNTTLVGNAPAGLFSAIGSGSPHTSSKWSTFGSNGTKLYLYGGTNPSFPNEIASYSLSTPYDITTASIDTAAFNPTLFLNPDGVMFNPDGTKIIFFEASGDPSIKQYDLNTAWNHTSIASTTPSATISNDPSYVQWDRGIFADSGSKFYAMQSNQGGKIVEFTCSTPGDLATASAVGSSNELLWNTAQGNGESRGIAMNAAGTKLYVGFDLTGDANEQIFQYDLSTPFDLSTATYNNKVLSNLRNDNFAEIRGLYLVNDTDLYVQGLVNPSGGQAMWKYAIPASGGGGGGGSNALEDGWTVRSTFTGMSNERFYSIDSDTSGNFYASGYDAVDDTILIASYDKDGNYRWSYNAGGNGDRLYGIGVDDPGNVIAVGYTASSSPLDGIIVKYMSDGTHLWTKTLSDGGSENWLPLAVAVKKNQSLGGDIYVVGATEAQSNSGNRNPFVAKLNTNGVVQWAKKYDHGGQQSQPEGIAIDSNGDLFVSGRIHEQITGGGYSSGMVMKLSSTDGSVIWQKFFDDGETINGYHSDQFQNCAVTPEDDVVTCGWANTDYLGSYYGVILKLSGTDGSVIWDRLTVENDGTKKITVDSAGKIYTFTDSEVFFKYASDGTLEQEYKITATGASDAYYLEDITVDNKDNAVLTGFFYTSGSDPAQPFITKLPATVKPGTSGDFVMTQQTKGDGAGGMTVNTFTSYTANTMSSVATANASGLTPSSVSATTTGPNTVEGVSSGGGGQSGPQGWISTISDELQGYGYPDTVIRSLAVDGSDNIYAGGDSMGNYQIVIKMASDGTVTSAASFGGSGATNNHRAIAVASDGSIYTAGEAKDIWNKKDGHVMRLTTALAKSYDDFFGEGYDDEHLDITADSSGNVFSVGQAQSAAFNWSSNPKGHIVKHDSTGGQAKVLIGTNSSKSFPQGVSTDGTNPYVILKDDGYGMVIAKLNSALSSITWARLWGASNTQDRMMDIDTNSSGESAAHMWQVPELKVAKIDSSGNDTWRKTWSKASTDHGVADGSHILSGHTIKLLSNGSVALLAGPMPWTTQANKKSLYIVIFDSTGTPTVQKEFRLNNASHYLATAYSGNAKALVELSDGKIVFAYSYYTGSNAAGAGWRNAIIKFDPTDTSTAINGTHGDWDISDITDSTTSADGASWSSHTTNLDTNMSMYFKSGYQGVANGFNVSSATVVEGTQTTLNYSGGGSGPYAGDPTGVTHNFNGGVIQNWTVTFPGTVSLAEITFSNATLAASATKGDVIVVENSYIDAYNSYNNIGWQNRDSGDLIMVVASDPNGTILTVAYAQEMVYSNYQQVTLNLDFKTYFDQPANERGSIPAGATLGYSSDTNINGTTGYHRWRGGTATLYKMFQGSDLETAIDTSGGSNASGADITGSYTALATKPSSGSLWFGDRGLLQFNMGSSPWTEITGVVDITTNSNSTYWGDLVGHGNYTGAASDRTIGVWVGSSLSGPMSYMTFATQGNSVSFGDGNSYGNVNPLHNNQSNGTYGMMMSGYQSNATPQDGIPQGYTEVMQRYTFAQTSTRPTDHGDLRLGGTFYAGGGVADATNSFIMGGTTGSVNYVQAIDYVAFATPGNSTQFGNMSAGASYGAGCSDETYGVYAIGYTGSHNNTLDYITMATPGNATDFGDLQQSKRAVGSTNNATRGIFWGGYTGSQYRNNIDVVTITTPSNATQFGNLHLSASSGMYERQGCSGNA